MMKKGDKVPAGASTAKPMTPALKPGGSIKSKGLKYNPSGGVAFLNAEAKTPPKC